MRVRYLAAPLMFLAFAACGQQDQTPAPAPSAGGGIVQAAAPASCDSPAAPIAVGASVNGEITSTTQPYPANARYFCFMAPEGAGSVTITLSGMSTDLDLYVGSNTIQSVQGIDISAGQNYEWKSNDFGTGDEQIVINQPRAGVYYAEIISYEGAPSAFTFQVR